MTPITMDNTFTFFSITEASLYLKGNITCTGNIYKALKDQSKTAYGHKWTFAKYGELHGV
jgi:hypothetical protein